MKWIKIFLAFTFIISCTFALPNIVFILTDDQDVVLGGMEPMLKTKKLIGENGITFSNAFVTTPICCPSRSSILTGRYIHNHGTFNNSMNGGCSSTQWQANEEPRTYGAHLNSAGYNTFYAGKYLNEYGRPRAGGVEHIPDGWNWWIGLVGNSIYYNYSLSVNGTGVSHGDVYETDYLTDVIKRYGLEFLNSGAASQGPFLMVLSTPSPHAPFTPADQYKSNFSDVISPRTPNFNVHVSENEKHWIVGMPPSPLPNSSIDHVDDIYRRRWATLLSVDDLVEEIVNKLEEMEILDNTYVLFSSDHGFHFGQFSMTTDKRTPYEFDIRVPLLVRGPGVPANVVRTAPITNLDFAPTFIELAGLSVPDDIDGTSFVNHLQEEPSPLERSSFLVEYVGEYGHSVNPECPWANDPTVELCDLPSSCKCFDSKNNTFNCLRQLSPQNTLVCWFVDDVGFVEAYDMTDDPDQLSNLVSSMSPDELLYYENWQKRLKSCSGRGCHDIEYPTPETVLVH